MEKEKRETENCAKKEMHVDFPARYIPSILHFFLCSLYLNLFKGLSAGIVGQYGGMEKEKKEEKKTALRKKCMWWTSRPRSYFTSILDFLLCLLYLNLFKCLGAEIVGEYGGMEKEKQ
jgi:hypothetical protein